MGTSYLKALQLQKKLEEKAKQEAENRGKAEELIVEVDGVIADYKKAEIDVKEAEAERNKARGLMDSKEFSESLGVLGSAQKKLEEAKENQLDNMLSSSEDMITLSDTLGADTTKAKKKLEKAQKAVDDGVALQKIIKLVREVWGEAEKVLQERVSGTFSAAQSLLNKAKELGKDTAAGETLFKEAREAVDGADYRTALHKLADCVEIVGSKVKDYLDAVSDDIKDLVKKGESSGLDMSGIKDDLAKVESLLEESEYEEALKATELLKENAGKMFSDSLSKRIKKAENNIKVGKEINADISKAESLISEAKKAMHNDDYSKAVEVIAEFEEEVSNACFQSVLKVISNSRGKFLTAKKVGADISAPLETLNKARDALKNAEFKDAIKFAEESDNQIDELVTQYEDAKSTIELVEENLALAQELGVDTALSEQLMGEARTALSSNEFKKALNLINKGREKIENAGYERVMEAIEQTESSLTLAEKVGIDTKELGVLLESSISNLKNKKFKDALDTADNTRAEITELMTSRLSEIIQAGRNFLSESTFTDNSSAMELLDQAEAALSEGVLDEAYKLSQKANVAISNLQEDRVKDLLKEIEDGINLLEELGEDVSKLLPSFNRASSLLKDEDYGNATETAKECLSVLLEVEKETFEGIFSSAKLAAVEARRKGISIDKPKKLLEEAKNLYSTGKYSQAITNALEGKKMSEDLKEEYVTAYTSITEVAGLMTEAKKDGIDIKPVAKVLMQAKKALEAQNFEKALSITNACRESLGKIQTQYTAAKRIVYSQMLATTASKIELDAAEEKKQLDKAKALMKGKEFNKSLELAQDCVNSLEKRIEDHLINLISKTESSIESARLIGIKVEAIEEKIEGAKEKRKAEDFEGAYKFAKEASISIDDLSDVSRKAVIGIQEAKAAISNALNVGADVMAAKILMEQAVADIKDNKYQDAISKTEKISDVVDKAQAKKVETVISSFEEAVKEAGKSIDIKKSEKMLTEARQLLSEKNYKEALNMAMQSESELEKVSLQHKMAEESYQAAKAKLDDMAKEGVPGGDAKDLLDKAKEALGSKDYVQALSVSVEAGEKAHSIKEAHLACKEVIMQAINRIKALKEQGVNVKSAEAIVAGAHAEFKNQDYTQAKEYAGQAVGEAESKYHDFVKGQIDEVKTSFVETKDRGGNTDRAESIMSDVEAAWKEKEYPKVYALMDKIQIVLNYEAKGSIRKKISMVEVAIDEAKAKGVDVTKASDLIHDAIIELENNNFEKAMAHTDQASELVSGVEDERKEMEDTLLAAESLMTKAKKFGIDMKNVKKMYDDAKSIVETDVEQALNLAETARDEAQRIMDELTPRIKAELTVGNVYAEDWAPVELMLLNTGRALGKDIKVNITGVETRGLKGVDKLMGGGSDTQSIQIMSRSVGDVTIKILGECMSMVDKKNVSYEHEMVISVEEKQKASFKVVSAEATTKCGHCNGTIKPGMQVILCECGVSYHMPCSDRKGVCDCGKSVKRDGAEGGDKSKETKPPVAKKIALNLG